MKNLKNALNRQHSFGEMVNKPLNQNANNPVDACGQICQKFKKQQKNTKLNPIFDMLKFRAEQNQKIEKLTKNFENSASEEKLQILKLPKSLPKMRQATYAEKKKIKQGNYEAQKFIVNETVYIRERCKKSEHYQNSMQSKSKDSSILNSILNSRNKKLIELRKRKIDNGQSPNHFKQQKNQKKIISRTVNTNKSTIHLQKCKIIAAIVQSQEKISKSSKEIMMSDYLNQKMMNQSPQKDIMQGNSKPIQSKTEFSINKEKWKSIEKTYNLKERFKCETSIARKKINWKNMDFPLDSLQKQEIAKLFRRYIQIGKVQPPMLGFYKFYIGEGNNSKTVAKCLKSRGYWIQVDSLADNPNFIWTQRYSPQFQKTSSQLKSKKTIQLATQNVQTTSTVTDEQIRIFLKYKNSQFLKGCKKILPQKIYHKVLSDIIKKLKKGLKVSFYSQIQQSTKQWLNHYKTNQIQSANFTQQSSQSSMQSVSASIKSQQIHLQNHFNNSSILDNKKSLYKLLTSLEACDFIPATLHINFSEELSDNLTQIRRQISNTIPEGPWIVKPGEETNRGKGIVVVTQACDLAQEIRKRNKMHLFLESRKNHHQLNLNLPQENDSEKSVLVQQYIQPLLYNNRKFDIRVWVLKTGGQVWWYQEGYLRTSSKQFNPKSINRFIHLTNDAVQMTSEDYGKYQNANKLSFNEFQKYLSTIYEENSQKSFSSIYKSMKQITKKLFNASKDKLYSERNLNFELFGLDFLVDKNLKVWLIECNKNPSLQIHCSLQTRLIPNLIDNVFSIVIDPLFPSPQKRINTRQSNSGLWNQQQFKFQILLDQDQDN